MKLKKEIEPYAYIPLIKSGVIRIRSVKCKKRTLLWKFRNGSRISLQKKQPSTLGQL